MDIAGEILDQIKKYHQVHNGILKEKLATNLLHRLEEIEREAVETDKDLPPWFPAIVFAYWQYHRAQTGLDKLKWKAHIDQILESIKKEDT